MLPRLVVFAAAAFLILPVTGVTTVVALVDSADNSPTEAEIVRFSGPQDDPRRHFRIVSPTDLMLDGSRKLDRDLTEGQEAVLPASASPSVRAVRPDKGLAPLPTGQ